MEGHFYRGSSFDPTIRGLRRHVDRKRTFKCGDESPVVFWRWSHALPGHRAFSQYANNDPRIDVDRLRKALGADYPSGPEAENKTWYRFFKEEEKAPEVQESHREFLFARDYAGLAAIFLAILPSAAVAFVPSGKTVAFYGVILLCQFLIVRHVASLYGARFVCTVLAVHAAKIASASTHLKLPRESKSSKTNGRKPKADSRLTS